jgi:hypothetical protein
MMPIDPSIVNFTTEHDFRGIRFFFNYTMFLQERIEYELTGAGTYCYENDEQYDGAELDLGIFKESFIEEMLHDLKVSVESENGLNGIIRLEAKEVHFEVK